MSLKHVSESFSKRVQEWTGSTEKGTQDEIGSPATESETSQQLRTDSSEQRKRATSVGALGSPASITRSTAKVDDGNGVDMELTTDPVSAR